MPILRIEIPDDLHQRIDAQKPEYLDRKGFVCLILDQALDRGSSISAYHVGAGNTFSVNENSELQSPPGLEVTSSSPHTEAVPSKKRDSIETRSLIPNLEKFDDLIREFFRLKKGSKSKTAWAHLMTGLSKIQTKYGDTIVEEQLMAAINGRWNGITLKNYEEFGKPKPKPAWHQEPEMKHPAHRDFTAERIAAERAEREEEEKHNFFGF